VRGESWLPDGGEERVDDVTGPMDPLAVDCAEGILGPMMSFDSPGKGYRILWLGSAWSMPTIVTYFNGDIRFSVSRRARICVNCSSVGTDE